MNDNKGSPTKKRKANDCRATMDGTHDVNGTGDNNDGGFLHNISGQRNDASSGPSRDENNTSQLDRMEQIMMRVEEKLATVSSLESQYERLEAKCSSLENMLNSTTNKIDCSHLHLEQKCDSLANKLETKVDTVHVKVDKSLKFHEYNEMLMRNQDWKYSADVDTTDELIDSGYTYDEADYLAENAPELEHITTKMRRGEIPCEKSYGNGGKGIYIEMTEGPQHSYVVNNALFPHWKEFAAALKQFAPAINVLPDNCESFFEFYFVQLNHDAMVLIKEALIGKPFQKIAFTNNNNGDGVPAGMSVDAILDVVESNKLLRKLQIDKNGIGRNHIERLCSAVHTHPALVELDLYHSCGPGIGDEMLTALLTSGEWELEKLDMAHNNITSAVSTLLADFLASNPRLKKLDLGYNYLNDSDASLIANALRSNKTLRSLDLSGNRLTDVGVESLRRVLCDESSLNSASDSNHICILDRDNYNLHARAQINRGWKVYRMLSSRNQTLSNVQHFGDIDVKLLPNMLEAVLRYHNAAKEHQSLSRGWGVEPLSIVYEVMRKWDKAFPIKN